MKIKNSIISIVWLWTALAGTQQAFGQFKIIGYVPNWINLTTFSNNFDYSRVTHLNIAFKDPNANGDLPAMSSGENALVSAAHTHGVQVFMSICGGASSTNTVIRERYFDLISPAKRSAFASKLKNYLLTNNLDGLDVDLEGPAINDDYGDFIQVLGDTLHPAGLWLTSALSQGYGGGAVPVSTFEYFDWINIMAYDASGPGWGVPGQHSSYEMAEDALNYWKGRGLARAKAVLGVPFYGYEFGSDNPRQYAVPYHWVATNHPSSTGDDDLTIGVNTLYYNGIYTIMDKTSLALVDGGGIMIWELSQDAAGNNSLLKSIRETAGDAVTSRNSRTEDKTLAVYPNPTTGVFSVGGELEQATLELYNTLGEKVQTFSGGIDIDISREPKGIYYLHIMKEKSTSIKRIVLQ